MIYTTFEQLIRNLETANPRFIQMLERLIGTRSTYGLTTPIYIHDLLDSAGIDIACTCLDYASEDTKGLQQSICIDLVRAFNYIWAETIPTSDTLTRVLDACESYLSASSAGELRTDACGEPIPGPDGNTWQAILRERRASAEAVVSGLDLRQQPVVFAHWLARSIPWTEAGMAAHASLAGDDWSYDASSMNCLEPLASPTHVGGLPGYTQGNIYVMLGLDGDVFLNQSVAWDAVQVPGWVLYGGLFYKNLDESQGTMTNPAMLACSLVGQAALRTAFSIIGDFGNLAAIVCLLRSALTQYAAGRRFTTISEIARLDHIARYGVWLLDSHISPRISTMEREIASAGNTRRAELCRSLDFINAFDADMNGELDLSERQTMEIAIREEMLTARKNKANEYLTEANAIYANAASYDSQQSIIDIVRPYLV